MVSVNFYELSIKYNILRQFWLTCKWILEKIIINAFALVNHVNFVIV